MRDEGGRGVGKCQERQVYQDRRVYHRRWMAQARVVGRRGGIWVFKFEAQVGRSAVSQVTGGWAPVRPSWGAEYFKRVDTLQLRGGVQVPRIVLVQSPSRRLPGGAPIPR